MQGNLASSDKAKAYCIESFFASAFLGVRAILGFVWWVALWHLLSHVCLVLLTLK